MLILFLGAALAAHQAPSATGTGISANPDASALAPALAVSSDGKLFLSWIDLSPDMPQIFLTFALSLAREADAHLTLLNVIVQPPELRARPTPEGINVDQVRAAAEAEQLRRLRALVPDAVRPYCTIETAVQEGSASRQILRQAAERKSDLIVMGIRGRNAIDLMVFGSTTRAVIQDAICPVLTIRGR